MIILKNENDNLNMLTLKHLYLIILRKEFDKEKYNESEKARQILNLFTENEIYDAFNSIYINGNELCIPERGNYSVILRYIEFGGENVKAMQLLSKSARALRMIGG